MTIKIKTGFLLLVFFLFIWPTLLWSDQNTSSLRVGVFQNPPLSYMDDQYATGIYPDLVREIANKENWTPVFVFDSWSGCLSRLEKGDIDLMISIVFSKEREKLYDFTKIPVVTTWAQVYAGKDTVFSSILDLEGKKIATMGKDINAHHFETLTKKFSIKTNTVKVDSYEAVCDQIQSGQVDAGIINNISGSFLQRRFDIHPTPIIFNPVSGFFAFPKGKHGKKRLAIDHILSEWKKDPTSVYYDILNKWYGNINDKNPISFKYIAMILIFVIGICLLLVFWMYILKHQVRTRTKELWASEEKYRSMMESMTDAVYICSENFRVEYMNKAMIKRIGRDATGESCFKALHNQEKQCVWCVHDQIQTGKNIETEIISPLDNRSYHVSQSPIYNPKGTLSKITIYRDITNYKKMELQLRQSRKMEAMGTLAGGIAHDFNNILFPIMGYSELLMDDLKGDSDLRAGLEKILSSARRASDLVQQILTFSRQEKMEVTLFKAQPVIKEALKLLRASIPTTIEIKQQIDRDCGILKMDPTQVHQIVMNLVTNAYHALAEKGGQIFIHYSSVKVDTQTTRNLTPGDYACLVVEDTGIGMEQPLIDKIFDPFFTTKKKGHGTGMGLSVVHGIVTGMNGSIQVDSTPGKGTKFMVLLPVEDAGAREDKAEKKRPLPKGTEKILLVDDEEAILTMAEQMLIRLGYLVISRVSSIEALNCFSAAPHNFDLVITDMAMPNMAGDILSQELIKIRPDIPILLCTGFSENLSKEKVSSLGIRDILMKPIAMGDLAEKVRLVLDKQL